MASKSTRISVAVRIRPLLPKEQQSGYTTEHIMLDQDKQTVIAKLADQKNAKSYKFNQICDSKALQKDVYKNCGIGKLISRVIEGFNATIFVYGQTGAGKTYTMEGYSYASGTNPPKPIIQDDENRNGLVQRSLGQLYKNIQEQEAEFHVYATFVQIYNEKIYDLLNPAELTQQSQGHKMRWNKYQQFYVENLHQHQCSNYAEVMALYNAGILNRVIAGHNMNASSSRSHSILTITIESIDSDGAMTTSKLQLVDLSGSEKTALTGNEGAQLKESIDINKSLFTLRQVITALSAAREKGNEAAHVPYRDSKLTSLLKQSIGGNSFTLMIACIAPIDAYLDENLSTLAYANMTGNISNEPVRNVDPKTKALRELKGTVATLKKELAEAYQHIDLMNVPTTVTGRRDSSNPRNEDLSYRTIDQDNPVQPRIPIARTMTTQPSNRQKMPKFQSDILSPEILSEKLQDSVNMLKESMAGNKKLRATVDELITANKIITADCQQLQLENQDLRDRNEMLEAMIPQTNPASPDRKNRHSTDSNPRPRKYSAAVRSKTEHYDEDSWERYPPNPPKRELQPIKAVHQRQFRKISTEKHPGNQNITYETKVDWKSKKQMQTRKSELGDHSSKGISTQPVTAERRRSGGKFRTISASGTRDPNKSDVISALSTLILKRAEHNHRQPPQNARNRHHY